MPKYRVLGSCTLVCTMDVIADSGDEAIEIANDEFGSLANYAGMGGTGHLVGVLDSSDNRCIYPDCEPEFDSCERIDEE